MFDGTLRQGLAVQLRQSPFLSLISDQRIQQTLRLMGQPADARLTADVARQICERTSSVAVLEGSIASLGSEYVLGLRATNCQSSELLDEQQAQAPRKEDVLIALGQIASNFRTRVGESLATVERHATPLPEATTPSLDALKTFDAALRMFYTSGGAAAIPLLKRAVEIDRQFAIAHAQLGLAYSGVGESILSIESTTAAYQLRHRTSEHEAFFISTMYDRQVTGNLAKASETLRLWRQTYPRDVVAHGLSSGFSVQGSGQYEESIAAAKQAILLDPDVPFPYATMAYGYVYLDRFEEATGPLQLASQRKIAIPDLTELRYHLAFLNGDRDGMDRAAASVSGDPGAEGRLSLMQSLVLARSGQLQLSRKMSDRAVNLAEQARQTGVAALCEAGAAVSAAVAGDLAAARRSADIVLDRSRGRDAQYGAALALALAGEFVRSQTLASDLEKRFPEDTSVQYSYLPTLRALSALGRGEAAMAIELLRTAERYELAVPAIAFSWFFGGMYPNYVRGLAYLDLQQTDAAAAEFQKILDHRGLLLGDPMGALVHLQLGRTFASSGAREKAKASYETFLALWANADPELPVLEQARAEYARL